MKVTYYGHACFGVETGGKHLLFDPFISGNPLAAGVKINSIKADYLLLSHAHEDHVLDALTIAQKTGAMIISCYEICMYYAAKGIKSFRPMNVGGAFTVDGITIKCVNAIHTSSFADGADGGVPMGFVITSKEGSFYYAGDTALTYDMKLVGEEFALKFAILPCGDNFTMGPEDAIKAAGFVQCSNIVGMHYNTFDLIKINTDEVAKKFEQAGKKMNFLKIGETREIS
jgi:L-ascorbate metabolism protein UlaG (beta-lactamase superfamily)